MALTNDQLKFFADFIQSKLGIIYSPDNYYQLEKRLTEIAMLLSFANVEELYQKAQSGIVGQMKMLLLDLATNNETSFFRDAGLFKAIEDKVLTESRWSGDNPAPLRLWSAATSTGQEVYSMSILLNAWQRHNPKRNFTFLATDYSLRVLKQAEGGIYSQLEVQRGLPATSLVRYFHNPNKGEAIGSHSPVWVVNPELKKNITFKQLNLLDDWGNIGPFDIVLCRNVLIYQNVENKRRIIAEIHRRLAPGGYLILGAAESLMGLSDSFQQVQLDKAVVYRRLDVSAKLAG